MKKWQLKRLSTGEALNEPQDLPDNWKNISSLKGSIDRLNDLAWAGHPDMGWFEVDVPDPVVDIQKVVDDQIAHFLMETAPMVAMDNISMTKAKRQEWMDYRKKLQEIPLNPDYPNEVFWPTRPE
jgi:hypothetical protein